jgi:Flp pilus assembly protein TadG
MVSTAARPPSNRPVERGQILVLFALGLVAIIAMVGLVLDGGGTYAQRRSQQNAADLAALAGANDYLLNSDSASAIARARTVAGQNGYTHNGNATVNVSIDLSVGANVTVDISAEHRNAFAGVVGMPTWAVSTTATARAGFPDTASGAGPMIFSIDAFGANGQPLPAYADPGNPYAFGEGNGDVPNGPGDLAWTNYGTGNVNTSEVRDIIGGSLVINKTLAFGEYIGQHNNGNHTALYDSNSQPSVNTSLSGQDIPVPVVDHNGNFMGWATFHVDHAVGGSEKHVYGYFVSPFVNLRLTVGSCAAGSCPRYLGSPSITLVN